MPDILARTLAVAIGYGASPVTVPAVYVLDLVRRRTERYSDWDATPALRPELERVSA